VALVYQGIWSIVLTLFGSYSDLLTFTSIASVFFGGLTVAAVYRLRATQPDCPRPYRCWGYPVTPALYLVIWLLFLIYIVLGAPWITLIGTLLILSGIPFYLTWKARQDVP
jgi:APA family basic amino acid/polyamine antiporter